MPLGLMCKHLKGNALGTTALGRLSFRGKLVSSFVASTQPEISLVLKDPIWKMETFPQKKSVKSCNSLGDQDHIVLSGLLTFLGDYLTSEARCCSVLPSKVSDITFPLIL